MTHPLSPSRLKCDWGGSMVTSSVQRFSCKHVKRVWMISNVHHDSMYHLKVSVALYFERAPKRWAYSWTHPNKWRTVQWQVTQHMQIPLSYADAVIGTAGANISYMRHTSGATITIQETRGVPGEMTVEIHGSASQVQTAQQLVQVWFSPSLFISISSWPVCLSMHVFSV